jgi:hypothetical protein
MKVGSKLSISPHRHFTKHLADALGKSPQESNSNHETSSLLIRRLENNTGFHLQEFTIQQQIDTALQAFCRTLDDHSQDDSQKTKTKQRSKKNSRTPNDQRREHHIQQRLPVQIGVEKHWRHWIFTNRQQLPRTKRSAHAGAVTERTKTEAQQHRSSEAVKDLTGLHSSTKATRKSRIRATHTVALSA